MIPLHGFGGTAPSPGLRLSAAAVIGLAATLGATVAMWRQSYGYVPPYVAAAALWREPPSEVSRPAADVTHLAAGVAAGIVFEGLHLAAERLREILGVGELDVAGVTGGAELLAAALVVCLLYGVFSWLVFPRYGGNAFEARPATVRRGWALSAAVYGLGLVAGTAAVSGVLLG